MEQFQRLDIERLMTQQDLLSSWRATAVNHYSCLQEKERTVYDKNGKIHRAEGPAIVWDNSTHQWWQVGLPGAQCDGTFNIPMDKSMLEGSSLISLPLSKVLCSNAIAIDGQELLGAKRIASSDESADP